MENSNIVKQAIDYIRNESYKSDMTIDDVAANAGFSTNYFNSIFAAHTGFNVMEYVRFIRLKNAAMLLLKTNREVLDIALECGYEAHESFTRAFKRQYGNTPNEYRKKKSRAMFFEDFCNETVGARMIHEFPQLKIVDKDEAADHLLEKDSVRYGWLALNYLSMADQPFYLGDSPERGIIYVRESKTKMFCRIISDDYDYIAECVKIFGDDRFSLQIYVADNIDKVTSELVARGISRSVEHYLCRKVYTGEPFSIDMPDGIRIRALDKEDVEDVCRICGQTGTNKSRFKSLFLESFDEKKESSDKYGRWLFNGIYHNDEMIGFDTDAFFSVRGFSVNNGIQTFLPVKYRKDEIFMLSLKFMTNRILELGGIPTYVSGAIKSDVKGEFDPKDIGFRNIWNVYEIFKATD